MKKSWIAVLISLISFISCNENDEVIPRSNPRFSVTFVQEINASGVEFIANVYDFGSDAIEEYGFVFSRENQPRLGSGEVVKASGKPKSSFKLIGDHSMRKGETYYVVAFIKTDKSTVYSQPMVFISQGSEGFIFEKIEGGPEVYYGDTLSVIGDNFSTNVSNYEVKVNGASARIITNDDRSFQIIIPEDLGFGYTYDYDGKLVLNIKILDKTLEVFPDIQFYDPIIYPSDKEFRYDENFYIKGKYLRDNNLRITIADFPYNTSVLPLVSVSDTLLIFKPEANFKTLNPKFDLFLRGKSYEINESISIMRTELLPGQKLKSGSIYPHLNIQGTNFNSVYSSDNVFVSDVEEFQFYIGGEVTYSEAKISVQSNSVPNPRFFNIWAMNGGIRSENSVSVENTDPSLAYMRTYNFPFNVSSPGRSVNWRDKGIWLLDGKIVEVDPQTKTGRILKTVDLGQGNIASSFAVIHQDKVYFAGGNEVIANSSGNFYSYDLLSGILTVLPKIPSKSSTPRAVFVSGGYLYFGGGYYRDGLDIQIVKEGYRFNLNSKTWDTWNKVFPLLEVWDFETSFTYNGNVYGLVNEIANSDYRATRLMKYDNGIADWVELAKYPFLGIANGNVVMPLGDAVYAFLGNTLYKIDMKSYSRTVIQGVSPEDNFYGQPVYVFVSKDKIYTSSINEKVLYQLDPAYFRE